MTQPLFTDQELESKIVDAGANNLAEVRGTLPRNGALCKYPQR